MPLYRDNSPLIARDNHRLDGNQRTEYPCSMSMTFAEALAAALEVTKTPLRQIAEKAGVSYEQLKKVKQGKSQSTNVDDAQKVAAAFGLTLDHLLCGLFEARPTIALAGKVGAGAKIPLVDAYTKGDGPQVECPEGISPHGIVAVEVSGDSMEPIYSDGDVLFYTRHTHENVPSEAVGRRSVCEDADGNVWVKQVKRGDQPDRFHLISLNPGAQTMWNVALVWASPIRLHWPQELVRKV